MPALVHEPGSPYNTQEVSGNEATHFTMILTCPECATRYALDSALLAPGGRRVRCTECGTVWFETPEESTASPESPPAPVLVEAIPESVRPLPEPLILKPARPSRRALMSGVAAGIVLAVALAAGLGWAAVETRQSLVRVWPPSAILFELAGLKVSVPGEGLVFDQVKTALAGTTEAGATLTVTGKIINMTGAVLPLPSVVASVSGKDDPVPREIWVVPMPIPEIEAEKSFPFTITHAVQEGDGDRLTLRFSDEAHPEGGAEPQEH